MKHLLKLYPILFGLLILACNSSSDDSNPSTDVSLDNYIYVISGKINGEPFVYGQRSDATELDYNLVHSGATTVICAYYPETGGVNYFSGLHPNFDDESKPSMGIEFVRFFLCSEVNDYYQSEVFNDRFPLGDYEFSSDGEDAYGPAGQIGMQYSANSIDGPYYNSYGDQSGSYFEVTSSTPSNSYVLDVLVGSAQIVEGNFAVKFYNENDLNDVITITDGHFKVIPSL
ncbi:MAG TPA: hypothetical protein VKZ98_02710 [Aquaticitalea sp.]|nr:hypothetical protein [Aquaticitalea sp.]